MRPLTEIEQQRFALILDYYTRHGIDPTLREQRKMFRVSNGVVQNLRVMLHRKGALKKVGRHYIPIPSAGKDMGGASIQTLREHEKAR